MENVWNQTFDATTNLVDVYIKYVRDKVDSGFDFKLIRTMRGVGYVLSDE
jgi:DNA-binding response OmpR family regulator